VAAPVTLDRPALSVHDLSREAVTKRAGRAHGTRYGEGTEVDRARLREDDAASAAIAISTQSDAIAIREAQGIALGLRERQRSHGVGKCERAIRADPKRRGASKPLVHPSSEKNGCSRCFR
jgi:hypothetical protein